jgi:hypothetical protein
VLYKLLGRDTGDGDPAPVVFEHGSDTADLQQQVPRTRSDGAEGLTDDREDNELARSAGDGDEPAADPSGPS